MNSIILITIVVTSVFAQKPSYLAGSSGPELAYRFRTDTTTVGPLGNRLGGATGTTSRIPIDARGDHDLVDRLLTWPERNRPYWLVNYEAIERFRNQQNANSVRQGQLGQSTNLQSRFGGSEIRQNRNPGFKPGVDYDDFGNPIYA